MLGTRLLIGSLLIALTVGMLVGDPYLAPFFPFLFIFVVGLSAAACLESVQLLGKDRAPQPFVALVGTALLAVANWLVQAPASQADPWRGLLAIFTGLVLAVFLYEMARFTAPGRSVERMAVTVWLIAYLGLLPCFFAQLRWLYPDDLSKGSVALALAIFVPKGCDTGAYFTGRMWGRHPLTPVLSPKKTWEGALGGLITAALFAIAIDQLTSAALLRHDWLIAIGFGLTVGLAGMLGDLAESLFKRDCQKKDAAQTVPGFGGVLDVVDSVVFAAPVTYIWLTCLT